MAIVKFGGGLVGIRGQLAGNVYSANSNGAYVRSWATVSNPRTINQFFRRYPFQALPGIWAQLGPETQGDWNLYGKAHPKTNPLGDTYYATGWQWFVGCNQHLSAWGGHFAYTAPTAPGPTRVDCTELHYQPNGLYGDVAIYFDEDVWTDLWCIVHAHVVPWGGVLSWPSTYYQMRADWSLAGATTTLNFGLQHDLKFGQPQQGYRCFCRVYTGDAQGLVSVPWEANAQYPAL